MRCKPGDLAMIVRGNHAENIGVIVEVVRLAEIGLHTLPENGNTYAEGSAPRWVIKSHGRLLKHSVGWPDSLWHIARDCTLRPIRPSEGQDETLTWAGKPQEVRA